jgi:hypothetical protein
VNGLVVNFARCIRADRKAAVTAQQLHLGLIEWLEQNRTKVFDYPFKIAVFGLGVTFLNSIGVQGDILSFVSGLLLGRATKTAKPKATKKKKS